MQLGKGPGRDNRRIAEKRRIMAAEERIRIKKAKRM